jgi:RimJ/RimL family protein N-acetyltransferase
VDLTLRPVQDDDLPLIFAWQSDPASTAMAGVPSREREAFDAHWAKIRADPDCIQLTAVEAGTPVAAVMCFPRDGQRELGYWVAREHWGRGVASTAVQMFLADYPVRPLGAKLLATNTASLRVLQKAGFVEVGRPDDEIHLQLD